MGGSTNQIASIPRSEIYRHPYKSWKLNSTVNRKYRKILPTSRCLQVTCRYLLKEKKNRLFYVRGDSFIKQHPLFQKV